MDATEKISKSLKSAMVHLENVTYALSKKDENSFANSIWHLTAELEYMLFLLSITMQSEIETAKWKPNPELKSMETETILANVRSLLSDAEKFLAKENLHEAYKSAYIARNYMLKIQESLAKKKREALKKRQQQ
jgi:hypothetical protein